MFGFWRFVDGFDFRICKRLHFIVAIFELANFILLFSDCYQIQFSCKSEVFLFQYFNLAFRTFVREKNINEPLNSELCSMNKMNTLGSF